jgi:ATP:ADP antiporter, AAA family
VASSQSSSAQADTFVARILQRIVDIRPAEARALFWSWLDVLALFLAYYVLRPIRDELGVTGRRLEPALALHRHASGPVGGQSAFCLCGGALAPRALYLHHLPVFMLNLLVFMALLSSAESQQHIWIGRAFFTWVSVFNLFVISVFWSFIVDVFDGEQGKRLFGFLAAGATLGGIAGSALTSGFVERVGQNWLLLASMLLLEVAIFASGRLSRISDAFQRPVKGEDPHKPVGGGVFTGMTHTFRSPYLLGIAFFILFYSITSTFLYFQQATLAEAHFQNRAERTAFFANIDLG